MLFEITDVQLYYNDKVINLIICTLYQIYNDIYILYNDIYIKL